MFCSIVTERVYVYTVLYSLWRNRELKQRDASNFPYIYMKQAKNNYYLTLTYSISNPSYIHIYMHPKNTKTAKFKTIQKTESSNLYTCIDLKAHTYTQFLYQSAFHPHKQTYTNIHTNTPFNFISSPSSCVCLSCQLVCVYVYIVMQYLLCVCVLFVDIRLFLLYNNITCQSGFLVSTSVFLFFCMSE